MFRFAKLVQKFFIGLYCKAHHVSYLSTPVFVGRWPIFKNRGRILLGEKCRFREDRTRHLISVIAQDAVLEFGTRCFIGDGANISAAQKISIGAYTKLAPNVSIYDTNFHPIQQGEDVFQAEVLIGRNVWIGQNSIILPGVSIGDHSIIGANSVVDKNIPARVVAAGAPAKIVKEIQCIETWIRD